MGTVKTDPKNELFQEANGLKQIHTKRVNGRELAWLAHRVCQAGLRKKELPLLKAGHVLDSEGNVLDRITLFTETICLTKAVRSEEREYLNYRSKEDGGPLDPNDPLSPIYLCQKTIYRHLRMNPCSFHQISRPRTVALFREYRNSGLEIEVSSQAVANRLRLTTRTVRDVLFKRRQPACHQNGPFFLGVLTNNQPLIRIEVEKDRERGCDVPDSDSVSGIRG